MGTTKLLDNNCNGKAKYVKLGIYFFMFSVKGFSEVHLLSSLWRWKNVCQNKTDSFES